MKQYRVETFSWTGKEYTSYEEALRSYELIKDGEMGGGRRRGFIRGVSLQFGGYATFSVRDK